VSEITSLDGGVLAVSYEWRMPASDTTTTAFASNELPSTDSTLKFVIDGQTDESMTFKDARQTEQDSNH
jgi:hypothetical protein